jgi:hypothetical protein
MPRRSAASLAVRPAAPSQRRLTPPPGMSSAGERLFREITSAVDTKHFCFSDLPLLVQFSEQGALADLAAAKLASEGAVIGGKPSPWLYVAEKAWRACQALAPKLRLTPSSRFDARAAARRADRPGPVDVARLLEDLDDE